MTTISSTPTAIGDDYSYYGVSSSYPLSNLIGSNTSSTKYAGVNLTRNSGGITYIFLEFDFSSIPENATINSISASAKIYGSTNLQSRTQTREVQMYSGNTAKGSPTEWDVSGSSVIYTIDDCGEWTRSELDNIAMRFYVVRNSSYTTSNTYMYLQGAKVTVDYTEKPTVKHTVTIQAGDGITTSKGATEEIYEGESYSVDIYGNISTITDNNEDILGKLVKKLPAGEGGNITANPAKYSTSGSIRGTNYRNCIGKGSSTTATGNDYCSSSGSTANITYTFDFSSIPDDAIINSVSVKVGGHCESTSNSNRSAKVQLYSGSTTKGEAQSFTSTSKQILTMDTGEWTREELENAKLVFTIGYYGGLINGVDFTVDYSLPNEDNAYYTYIIASVMGDHVITINIGETNTKLRVKVNGFWKVVKKLYRKSNGAWQEIDPSTIDSNTKFIVG